MILPEILSESEDGFVDLLLAVVADRIAEDGGRRFEVMAAESDETIGMAIELSSGWHSKQVGDFACFSGIVSYRSLGGPSDRFVSLLDRLYGVGLNPLCMVEVVPFAALTLGDDPGVIDSSLTHFKLFFEHDDEERYAEVYTNIDLTRGIVQIREKDGAYRRALIEALSSSEVSPGHGNR